MVLPEEKRNFLIRYQEMYWNEEEELEFSPPLVEYFETLPEAINRSAELEKEIEKYMVLQVLEENNYREGFGCGWIDLRHANEAS